MTTISQDIEVQESATKWYYSKNCTKIFTSLTQAHQRFRKTATGLLMQYICVFKKAPNVISRNEAADRSVYYSFARNVFIA